MPVRLGRPRGVAEWRLRSKLGAAVLLPSVLALALGGLHLANLVGDAREAERVVRFVEAQQTVADLVDRLGRDRYAAVAGGAGPDDPAGVDEQAVRAFSQVRALVADDPALAAPLRDAEAAVQSLAEARQRGEAARPSANTALNLYSTIVDRVDDLDAAVLRGINTREVNGLALALGRLSSVRNELSLQHALVSTGASGPDEPAMLLSSEARLLAGTADFRSLLDAEDRDEYAFVALSAAGRERAELVQSALSGEVAPAAVGPTFDAARAELDRAQAGLRTALDETSRAELRTAADLRMLNVVALAVTALLSVALIVRIARVTLTALATLRTAALDVARTTLPRTVHAMREGTVPSTEIEPVPIRTREEIGELARSFDAVHEQAVRLAAEQATVQNTINTMFVNLSRRSQTLIDCQSALLGEVRQREPDPARRADVVRIDRLATRMRRNSENLMILAGSDAGRRAAPDVTVLDLLCAAADEVDQRERIDILPPPRLALPGTAARDLQHLLSELLDNAVVASPPESRIRVVSFRPPDHPLVIDVVDDGIGMAPDDLAEANRALERPAGAGADAARRMGLFVIGRLAGRHGITVRLVPTIMADGPARGITARVTVPRTLTLDAVRSDELRTAPGAQPAGRTTAGTTGGWGAVPSSPSRAGAPAVVLE